MPPRLEIAEFVTTKDWAPPARGEYPVTGRALNALGVQLPRVLRAMQECLLRQADLTTEQRRLFASLISECFAEDEREGYRPPRVHLSHYKQNRMPIIRFLHPETNADVVLVWKTNADLKPHKELALEPWPAWSELSREAEG